MRLSVGTDLRDEDFTDSLLNSLADEDDYEGDLSAVDLDGIVAGAGMTMPDLNLGEPEPKCWTVARLVCRDGEVVECGLAPMRQWSAVVRSHLEGESCFVAGCRRDCHWPVVLLLPGFPAATVRAAVRWSSPEGGGTILGEEEHGRVQELLRLLGGGDGDHKVEGPEEVAQAGSQKGKRCFGCAGEMDGGAVGDLCSVCSDDAGILRDILTPPYTRDDLDGINLLDLDLPDDDELNAEIMESQNNTGTELQEEPPTMGPPSGAKLLAIEYFPEKSSKVEDDSKPKKKSFTCFICDRVCVKYSELMRHTARAHFSREVLQGWKVGANECHRCGKIVPGADAGSIKERMRYHLASAHEVLLQVAPPAVRRHLESLRPPPPKKIEPAGLRSKPEGISRPKREGICGLESQDCTGVQSEFVCPKCGDDLETPRKLKHHLAIWHFREKVLTEWSPGSPKCPRCQRRFNQDSRLKSNMLKHLAINHGVIMEVVPRSMRSLFENTKGQDDTNKEQDDTNKGQDDTTKEQGDIEVMKLKEVRIVLKRLEIPSTTSGGIHLSPDGMIIQPKASGGEEESCKKGAETPVGGTSRREGKNVPMIKKYACVICKKSFKTMVLLTTHLARKHYKQDILKLSGLTEASELCPLCGKMTKAPLVHLASTHGLLTKVASEEVKDSMEKARGESKVHKRSQCVVCSKDLRGRKVEMLHTARHFQEEVLWGWPGHGHGCPKCAATMPGDEGQATARMLFHLAFKHRVLHRVAPKEVIEHLQLKCHKKTSRKAKAKIIKKKKKVILPAIPCPVCQKELLGRLTKNPIHKAKLHLVSHFKEEVLADWAEGDCPKCGDRIGTEVGRVYHASFKHDAIHGVASPGVLALLERLGGGRKEGEKESTSADSDQIPGGQGDSAEEEQPISSAKIQDSLSCPLCARGLKLKGKFGKQRAKRHLTIHFKDTLLAKAGWDDRGSPCPECGRKIESQSKTETTRRLSYHLAFTHGYIRQVATPAVLALLQKMDETQRQGGGQRPRGVKPSCPGQRVEEASDGSSIPCPVCPRLLKRRGRNDRVLAKRHLVTHFRAELLAKVGGWEKDREDCPVCGKKMSLSGRFITSQREFHLAFVHGLIHEVAPDEVGAALKEISAGAREDRPDLPSTDGNGATQSFQKGPSEPEEDPSLLVAGGEKREPNIKLEAPDTTRSSFYPCPVCQADHGTFRELKDHLATSHFEEQVLAGWDRGSPECPLCKKRVACRSDMARHLGSGHQLIYRAVPGDLVGYLEELDPKKHKDQEQHKGMEID